MRIDRAVYEAGIDPMDAEVLMSALTGRSRANLLAHGEAVLTDNQETEWKRWTQRRTNGEPVAYITGKKEFYGRSFVVTHDTLIPRPATEGLIEAALSFLDGIERETVIIDEGIVALSLSKGDRRDVSCIADIGTGCGCIAVTLAMERPKLHCIATDIALSSLDVAKHNADLHCVSDRMTFWEGDLLSPITALTEPFIIVSNPPYVPEGQVLAREVSYEPARALYAGREGLNILSRLLREAFRHPYCRGMVLECREDQVGKLKEETLANACDTLAL